jgi:integrase
MARRNTGEVIRRGSIYYIRYYDLRGRRRLESTHQSDKAEAEKQLRRRLSAKDAGVSPDAASGKLTLREALDDVMNDYRTNKRRSTANVQRRIDKHVLPAFGERRRMITITTADLRAFVVERQREERDDQNRVTKRPASNAEINRELAVIRRAFRLAVQTGRLVQAPYVPMLQEHNVRTGFLEPDQFAAICAHLPNDLRPVVRFAYATGWRCKSEVLPLEWRHIDWAGRCVRLDPSMTKNGEGRSFPFTTEIEQILTDQLAERDRLKATDQKVVPFVFHRHGKRIRSFWKAWAQARTAAGYPTALIHDMRRSAVRRFERASVPRVAAMSMVGHKTESIYRRYAIVDEAMQREAAARLDAYLGTPVPPSKGTVRTFKPKAAKTAKARAQATA